MEHKFANGDNIPKERLKAGSKNILYRFRSSFLPVDVTEITHDGIEFFGDGDTMSTTVPLSEISDFALITYSKPALGSKVLVYAKRKTKGESLDGWFEGQVKEKAVLAETPVGKLAVKPERIALLSTDFEIDYSSQNTHQPNKAAVHKTTSTTSQDTPDHSAGEELGSNFITFRNDELQQDGASDAQMQDFDRADQLGTQDDRKAFEHSQNAAQSSYDKEKECFICRRLYNLSDRRPKMYCEECNFTSCETCLKTQKEKSGVIQCPHKCTDKRYYSVRHIPENGGVIAKLCGVIIPHVLGAPEVGLFGIGYCNTCEKKSRKCFGTGKFNVAEIEDDIECEQCKMPTKESSTIELEFANCNFVVKGKKSGQNVTFKEQRSVEGSDTLGLHVVVGPVPEKWKFLNLRVTPLED